MNKIKIAFWGILIAFIGLVIFQNQVFFMEKQSLKIDLFFHAYQTSELPNAIIFISFFLTGLLISYFFSLSDRFRSRKTIKGLTLSLESQMEKVSSLKRELDALNLKKEQVSESNQEVEVTEPAKKLPVA